MFDWPLQIHTSPTTTLVRVTVLAPASLAVRLPPVVLAAMGSSRTSQLPAASEVVVFDWVLKATVMVLLGAAVPDTGTGLPRCSTMLVPKSGASATVAPACGQCGTKGHECEEDA